MSHRNKWMLICLTVIGAAVLLIVVLLFTGLLGVKLVLDLPPAGAAT